MIPVRKEFITNNVKTYPPYSVLHVLKNSRISNLRHMVCLTTFKSFSEAILDTEIVKFSKKSSQVRMSVSNQFQFLIETFHPIIGSIHKVTALVSTI